jgi:methylated-DNA-[protein]-cysteine S-methyltransferase
MVPEGENLRSAIISTQYGWIGMLFSDGGLRKLTLPCDSIAEVQKKLGKYDHNAVPADSTSVVVISKQIKGYFQRKRKSFTCKYDLPGSTAFQHAVWQSAAEIPYGQVRSYRFIAAKIGRPGAYRAVGQALARNPIPLIIPCHRVINSDGKLGGFGGKANIRDFKEKLLLLEGALVNVSTSVKTCSQVNKKRRLE